VLPGLIDNHLHIIRGDLNFNMGLRWDGVRSLADAMALLRPRVAVTPAPQWVRVVGGFTEHQFAEKRLPTIEELNAAVLRVVGYTKDTPQPPDGEITRDAQGNPTGLLLAKPNAGIHYATLAKGPKLPFDYRLGTGALGCLTFVAMLVASDFWSMDGAAPFMALNTFFEHFGLVAGLVLAAVLSEMRRHPFSR
jgi:predicted amidohydrolase YtcJ